MKTKPIRHDSGEPRYDNSTISLSGYESKTPCDMHLVRDFDLAFKAWQKRRGIVSHGFQNEYQRGLKGLD